MMLSPRSHQLQINIIRISLENISCKIQCTLRNVKGRGCMREVSTYRLVRALMKMVSLNSRRSFLNLFACQVELLIYGQSAAKLIEDKNNWES